MKTPYVAFILITLFLLSGCDTQQDNLILENKTTTVTAQIANPEKVFCTSELRNADVCVELYEPVCGWFNENVKCIRAPCAITASNSCEACKNPDVEYYTLGECEGFAVDEKPKIPSEKFCGDSTKGACKIDSDCSAGGCSGQICEKKGEGLMTTCEYRDCYNAKDYGLSCGCIDNQCQWS